ncbi:hypothetical protein Q7I51_18775, partial [Escherichia coli]|uniref:hypothetical protein n=1 Tax=Escherichia coli TaxID=562 RepID=UPI003EE51700
PQNDVTLKMPAFEWVHVQLHQQKGMISLSPPTICNSADSGIIDLKRIDKRAVIIATIANNVALNHSFLNVCFSIHFQREIILHSLILQPG